MRLVSGPFPLLGCQIDLAAWISYASLGRSQHEHEESSEIKCRTRLSYHRKHARNRFISTSFTSSTRGTMEATRRDIICDSLSRGDTSRIKHYASAKLHFRLGWRKNARNVLTMYSTCSGRAGCRAASSSIAKLGMAADPRDLLPCSYQNASFSQAWLAFVSIWETRRCLRWVWSPAHPQWAQRTLVQYSRVFPLVPARVYRPHTWQPWGNKSSIMYICTHVEKEI